MGGMGLPIVPNVGGKPFGKRWLHSDIKDMAFPFTLHMFLQIREDMNGNE